MNVEDQDCLKALDISVLRYKTDGLPAPVKAVRYYLPVEIQSATATAPLYHYCCCTFPGNHVWPVGYCSKGCPGHESKDDARRHYRQFLIDRFGQLSGRLNSTGTCAICGIATTFYAWIDYHFEWDIVSLCPAHLNHEGLSRAFVYKDYHLLQISHPGNRAVATIAETNGLISIVCPGASGFSF
jgi:hypothetical protein